NALYQGSIQRIATTGNAVMTNRAAIPTSTHRVSRPLQPAFTSLLAGSLGDRHVGGGHVLVAATIRGRDLGDLVDDVHAGGDLAEHGVAVVRRARMVEEIVVDEIHEELRRRAVYVVGARHRQRAARVLQAVRRLVLDRRLDLLLLHAGLEAAALDRAAGNDAVEYDA